MSEQRPERPQRKNGRPTNGNGGIRFGSQRGLFGWVLFIALAVLLFMLLNKTSNQYTQIPVSEFESRLVEDKVRKVVVQGDELTGEFRNAETIPSVTGNVTKYRVVYPSGTFANGGPQFRWIMDHKASAVVEAENNQNLLINILVPLIPWLLIFGFIWFLVTRSLRGACRAQHVVLTGPGRWVPDPPAPPGHPSA